MYSSLHLLKDNYHILHMFRTVHINQQNYASTQMTTKSTQTDTPVPTSTYSTTTRTSRMTATHKLTRPRSLRLPCVAHAVEVSVGIRQVRRIIPRCVALTKCRHMLTVVVWHVIRITTACQVVDHTILHTLTPPLYVVTAEVASLFNFAILIFSTVKVFLAMISLNSCHMVLTQVHDLKAQSTPLKSPKHSF